MKLDIMLQVNEAFTTTWLLRSSKVSVTVRRWPQSLSGLLLWIVLTLECYSVRIF